MANWPYCWPWPQVRAQILDRDNHTCQVNGEHCTHHATHVDHIIPWREGGDPYNPANLRASCPPCNTSRANSRRTALAELNLRPNTTTPSRDW